MAEGSVTMKDCSFRASAQARGFSPYEQSWQAVMASSHEAMSFMASHEALACSLLCNSSASSDLTFHTLLFPIKPTWPKTGHRWLRSSALPPAHPGPTPSSHSAMTTSRKLRATRSKMTFYKPDMVPPCGQLHKGPPPLKPKHQK